MGQNNGKLTALEETSAQGCPGSGASLRGRPGRRSAEERSQAVLELLSGKASIQQLSLRFNVHEDTILKWRDDAVQGMASGLRNPGKTARERQLERELKDLRAAFTDMAIERELLERALRERPPTRRGRSAK